jgi:hypothetical protein
MELPDDVLALIREYSRPLSRREVSNFWKNKKVFDLDLMAESVLNVLMADNMIEYIIGLEIHNAVLQRDGNIWKIDGDNCRKIITFTDTDLLKWNGKINYDSHNYDPIGHRGNHEYLWEDTILFKQLLNGTQVIKEKLSCFYIQEKIKPRQRV